MFLYELVSLFDASRELVSFSSESRYLWTHEASRFHGVKYTVRINAIFHPCAFFLWSTIKNVAVKVKTLPNIAFYWFNLPGEDQRPIDLTTHEQRTILGGKV